MHGYTITWLSSDEYRHLETISLAWTFDTRTGSPANQALHTLLVGLRGVNSVTMGRYSATIELATWIVDIVTFMGELADELEDDREIPALLGVSHLTIALLSWRDPR